MQEVPEKNSVTFKRSPKEGRAIVEIALSMMEEGKTRKQSAEELGISYANLSYLISRYGKKVQSAKSRKVKSPVLQTYHLEDVKPKPPEEDPNVFKFQGSPTQVAEFLGELSRQFGNKGKKQHE